MGLDLANKSPAFRIFYEHFFGDPYMVWHDGIEHGVSALGNLEGEERDQAENLLIEALESKDHRPAIGLGVLRSEKAVPRLTELLDNTAYAKRINIAVALWQINGNPDALQAIVRILEVSSDWSIRMEAANALVNFKTPETAQLLLSILENDDSPYPRNAAVRSLLAIIDLHTGPDDHPLARDLLYGALPERDAALAELKEKTQQYFNN